MTNKTKSGSQPSKSSRLSAFQALQARMAAATPALAPDVEPEASAPPAGLAGGLMSALTGEANTREAVVAAGKYQKIPEHLIDFDPKQPRKTIDPEAIATLAASIAAAGLLQLPIVRPHPTSPGRYMVVFGERRIRALRTLHVEDIEARVEHWDDRMTRNAQIAENSEDARVGVSAWEEASAFGDLLEMLGSQKAVVEFTGHSFAKVSKRLALLSLPDPVKELITSGVLTDHEAAYDLGTLWKADPASASALVDQAKSKGSLERGQIRAGIRTVKKPGTGSRVAGAHTEHQTAGAGGDLDSAVTAWLGHQRAGSAGHVLRETPHGSVRVELRFESREAALAFFAA